jgi:dihydroxy-acid dehydratase
LALVRTGDRIRIDLTKRTADMLVDEAELARRRAEIAAVEAAVTPASQTPWQEIQRDITGQFDTGAVLEPAVKYQRIAKTKGLPRDSH